MCPSRPWTGHFLRLVAARRRGRSCYHEQGIGVGHLGRYVPAGQTARVGNGVGAEWPQELAAVFERSLTVEYGSLTRSGKPVTVPVSPYVGRGGLTLDVQTGLCFPAKADRARGNPKVCLLFADPIGGGMRDMPVVLVQGHAAVRDADLQGNTDRAVALTVAKYPAAFRGVPRVVLGRMAYYFARIWVEVTPLHIRWWPSRSLDIAPTEWWARADMVLPTSDPPPSGEPPPPWTDPPRDWRPVAARSFGRLGLSDLSTIDGDGYPICLPVTLGPLEGDKVAVVLGDGAPELLPGPACLSLHSHKEVYTGEENHTLVGSLVKDSPSSWFQIERALGDWSTPGNRLKVAMTYIAKAPKLAPRLKEQAARRGQHVPKVRLNRVRSHPGPERSQLA